MGASDTFHSFCIYVLLKLCKDCLNFSTSKFMGLGVWPSFMFTVITWCCMESSKAVLSGSSLYTVGVTWSILWFIGILLHAHGAMCWQCSQRGTTEAIPLAREVSLDWEVNVEKWGDGVGRLQTDRKDGSDQAADGSSCLVLRTWDASSRTCLQELLDCDEVGWLERCLWSALMFQVGKWGKLSPEYNHPW